MHVHRSERTDTLLAGLTDLLATIPADPFTPDIVAVPTPGIERFISQGLGLSLGAATGLTDGVCANVAFPSPAGVVNRAVAQASAMPPDNDPWSPQRMTWPLLAVIDDALDQPWCEGPRRYLQGKGKDRRFALASRLAGLFTSYSTQRPDLVLAWQQGHDEVPGDLAWQPHLWRALRLRIATPSPAERLRSACELISADPAIVDLPQRLSVFGPSRLPTSHLQVLTALGVHREVHLWLADPSPALWDAVPQQAPVSRRQDTSAQAVHHPLLRSLGRDARELRQRLQPDTDEHIATALPTGSLLGRLQHQISANATPTATALDPADRSVTVHACHGQARQAEVLREVILGLLQADPTLQARDILIMCPDLDAFAPLLSAAFTNADSAGSVRVRIADRTPEQDNDVLAALAALLELVTGRAELSTLLDFAGRTPVRTRFGFDEDGLERLEVLTAQAGIRWGLDSAHRAEYHLQVPTGTWSWGLDRLLLGAALSEDGLPLLAGVLPVDDVQSSDITLVGRLAELVTCVQQIRTALLTSHPVQQWVQILSDAIEDLMMVWGVDSWQIPNALAAIAGLIDTAGPYAASVELSLADVRWLLDAVLAGRPTRTNFRSGDLTVCGLAPMRSVPHRVICLVGMDDAAFPRALAPDGDDILAREPRIGERDGRSEDRQVFLDAIMAARDHLVITYTGADDRTNQLRPPCVPLGDLLDTLDVMTQGEARTRLLITHPLQPFDARNFTAGALGLTGPFSHDRGALAAAMRAALPREQAASLRITDAADLSLTDISPQEIAGFLCSPMATFLRTRLGISLRGEDDPAPEQIPVSVAGLARWKVGDRSLRLLNLGEPAEAVAAAERARGQLPPGALGSEILTTVGRDASDVARRYAALRTSDPRQVSVDVTLPNGVRVVGTVPDVHGDRIVRATFSNAKPRDDLRLWPELLALALTHPTTRWQGNMVTKDGGVTLTAPAPEDALVILTALVDLYRAGLASPLPLPAASGWVYAKHRRSGSSPSSALRAAEFRAWRARYGPDGELPEVVALWGAGADIGVLLEEPPLPQENWYDETNRFAMLARRVWQPILDAKGTA